MTGRCLCFFVVISCAGLALLGSPTQFVVLRQALPASDRFAAADSSALSADGRFVAFVSRARLVPASTHGENIYVFDRISGTVTLETTAFDGSAADGASQRPMLSADGRFLVFASYATNLVDAPDTNVSSDVFLRDRSTRRTRRVSIGAGGGDANGMSDSPAISNDGQVVAFASTASNLAGGAERHGVREVYVVRSSSGEPEQVPVGLQVDRRRSDSDSFAPALSGDGNIIAFVSKTSASHRPAVFVHDFKTNATTCITGDATGDDGTDLYGYDPHVSADGRLVVFTVARDGGSRSISTRTDIAVYDRRSSRTTPITRSANASSTRARISGNGRFVAFQSLASNLKCGHRCYGAGDQNLLPDIYVFDRLAETFTRVSGSVEEWWVPSLGPWLDAEGKAVIFSSRQPVDADDPTTDFDLFVRTLDPPATGRR